MKINNYNLQIISFVLFTLFINNGYCTLDSSQILEQTVISTSVESTNPGEIPNDIIAFVDETFVHLYIDSTDRAAYAIISQNGVEIDKIGPINQTGTSYEVRSISGCLFGTDQILVVYSANYGAYPGVRQTIYYQMIDKNGKVGSEVVGQFDAYTHDQWMPRCIQMNSQTIGVTAYAYEKEQTFEAGGMGVFFMVYKPYLGNTVSTPEQVNTYEEGNQLWQDIALLEGTDQAVITWRSDQDATSGGIGYRDNVVFFQIVNSDGSKEGGNIEMEGSDNLANPAYQYNYPFTESTPDGGFATVFGTRAGEIKFTKYSKTGQKICLETIAASGKQSPTLAIHGSYAYIAYKEYTDTNLSMSNLGKGWINKVDLTTCLSVNEIEFTAGATNTNVKYNPWIAISEGPLATIIGISYQTPTNNLEFVEIFIEQNGSCTNSNCVGCYGTKVGQCDICAGSTVANQQARKALSATCECPDTYYEDENRDCILCTGIYYKDSQGVCKDCLPGCDSCENGYSCIQCLDTSMNLELQCTCPTIFYNDSFGICQECMRQCSSCSDGNSCSECKDPTMLLESNCLFKKNGNLLVINPDGTTVVKSCHKKCENCTGFYDNCEGCAGQNRQNTSECQCLQGYHDYNEQFTDCEKCPKLCLECKSSNQCTLCDPTYNRYLNPFSGQCECEKGFKSTDNSLICFKCYAVSDGCVVTCPTNTVQNEKTQICEPLSYSLNSNVGSIIVFGVLIALIQIGLCIGIHFLVQKRYKEFQTAYLEAQMKLKQQRNHIYKDLENFHNSARNENSQIQTSQPGASSAFKQPNKKRRVQNSISHGRSQQDVKSNADKSVDDLMEDLQASNQQLVGYDESNKRNDMEDIIN